MFLKIQIVKRKLNHMKFSLSIILIFASVLSFAQPQGINYQGVARDASGQALLNQNISLQLSILDSTSTGTSVYIETQNTSTNNSGLFNLSIGTGSVVTGVFANISWGQGDKWLKIEMDATGGTNYQLIGTSQFLSVPYSFHSKSSDNGVPSGTNTGDLLYWNGSTWQTVSVGTPGQFLVLNASNIPTWRSENAVVGNLFQGGIIGYVLQPGDPGYDAFVPHGIIVTPGDQSTSIKWFNGTHTITGATGTAIGTGETNTNTIVVSQGAGNYAAKICQDLVLNGYDDWYLPSKDELNKIYQNKAAIGGFAGTGYWSSTEENFQSAWILYFTSGTLTFGDKNASNIRVRAIRTF